MCEYTGSIQNSSVPIYYPSDYQKFDEYEKENEISESWEIPLSSMSDTSHYL